MRQAQGLPRFVYCFLKIATPLTVSLGGVIR